MNEATLRALIEAGAVQALRIIAYGAQLHVEVITAAGASTVTTRKGTVKTWVTLDAAARWVKRLGIGQAQLDIARWQPR